MNEKDKLTKSEFSKTNSNNNRIIHLHDVTRILHNDDIPVTLVKKINLSIYPGDFVTITGPSGSGKSSLMYLLGLLDKPTDGKIYIDNCDVNEASKQVCEQIRLLKLGFVFQFHFLLPEFTALDNILLPMRKLNKLSYNDMVDRAHYLLEYFQLKNVDKKFPHQLSGGEKQRVSIARAMGNDPLIILADEPSGNLDTHNSQIVFDLFLKLCDEEQKTIVCITHEPYLAKLAKRQFKLVDAQLVHNTK